MAKAGDRSAVLILAVFLVGMLLGGVVAYNAALYAVPSSSENVTTETPSLHPAFERSATARIVGISAETNEGILGTATVELVPGHGRILISTNPFIEPDTQQSVSIARAVAENYTGISLESVDIIASFDLPIEDLDGQVIGGPSAGAALAVAIAAAAQNRFVRPDVAITGAILSDGTIGAVGGIIEKAQAAGEAGMALFIVPAGQGEVKYYERIEERKSVNGFSVVRISYMPRTLTLDDFARQWNMTAIEVENIAEAARYAITSTR